MTEKTTFNRLGNLAVQASAIRQEFANFLRVPEVAKAENGRYFSTLQVVDNTAQGHIDFQYEGIEIRLTLFLTYDELDRPNGRVICTHRFKLHNDVTSVVLGDFLFNQTGQTNLGFAPNGRAYTLDGDADYIVIGYLDKAAKSSRLDPDQTN